MPPDTPAHAGPEVLDIDGGPQSVAKLPPQRYFDFPPDVADKYAVRAMLAQTDVFGSAVAEARTYLDDALERFRITMALFPPLPPAAEVLELGANPYFLTRLLLQRNLNVRAANWFGPDAGFGERGSQRVFESGIPHEYEFDHFNIEESRFPYPDSSFDLVLFCEILEHLPHNPTHTLVEIHRVLREGGWLLLTTPNANRLENLVKVQRGQNMYESLSGHGLYGRHNREYTVDELREFLDGCGFDVEDILAQDLKPWTERPVLVPGLNLDHRGENLFLLARTRSSYRWFYPEWLYTSIHGFRRVVQPDLVAGVNCDLQATGLHHLEELGGRTGRWTIGDSEATALVSSPSAGLGVVRIEGRTPDIGGTIEIQAATDSEELSWTLPCDGEPFAVEGNAHVDEGPQTIRVWADRSWRPCDLKGTRDARVLGFMVHRVVATPHFGTPTGRDVIVGTNCGVQLHGVHDLEDVCGEPARWTDGAVRSMALLAPDAAGEARLTIQGRTPDLGGGLRLSVAVDGQHHEWSLTADGDPFAVTATVQVRAGQEVVHFWTDRPFRPSAAGEEETDDRILGFLLHSITIKPVVPPASLLPPPATSLTRKVFRRLPAGAQARARNLVERYRSFPARTQSERAPSATSPSRKRS